MVSKYIPVQQTNASHSRARQSIVKYTLTELDMELGDAICEWAKTKVDQPRFNRKAFAAEHNLNKVQVDAAVQHLKDMLGCDSFSDIPAAMAFYYRYS